jgi:hypothetical protein
MKAITVSNLHCGFDAPRSWRSSIEDEDTISSMQRILNDDAKFTEMCRDLLTSIPEDLKDNERSLMTMISECIDASNSIQISTSKVEAFVDEYLTKNAEETSESET